MSIAERKFDGSAIIPYQNPRDLPPVDARTGESSTSPMFDTMKVETWSENKKPSEVGFEQAKKMNLIGIGNPSWSGFSMVSFETGSERASYSFEATSRPVSFFIEVSELDPSV